MIATSRRALISQPQPPSRNKPGRSGALRRNAGLAGEGLRRGGSAVELHVFAKAYHQWDGNALEPKRVCFSLRDCRIRIDGRSMPHDEKTGLPITRKFNRLLFTVLNARPRGYAMLRDEETRDGRTSFSSRFWRRSSLRPVAGQQACRRVRVERRTALERRRETAPGVHDPLRR
ncbi:MAG TPA: hypothetical protein VF342_09275 [Alphaproteobacteria bacterium]